MGHRISHKAGFDIFRMGAPVCEHNAEEVHVLIKEDDDTGMLKNLSCVWGQRFTREPVRQTFRCRIIMQDLAGLLLHEQGLASRFEGSEVFGIKVGDSGSVGVVSTDSVMQTRPL